MSKNHGRSRKPRRTRQHVIASLSRNYVEGIILAKGHTAERRSDDYGYDLDVETMVKTVTYRQLRTVLSSLGCRPVPSAENRFVFEDPNRDLLLILPGGTDEQLVRSIDLSSIWRQLVGHGVIKDDEDAFDSLFLIRKGDRLIWTDPKTGKDTKVTAAAGESDGLVVVKHNGALVPCPVGQVRRIQRAARAARKSTIG